MSESKLLTNEQKALIDVALVNRDYAWAKEIYDGKVDHSLQTRQSDLSEVKTVFKAKKVDVSNIEEGKFYFNRLNEMGKIVIFKIDINNYREFVDEKTLLFRENFEIVYISHKKDYIRYQSVRKDNKKFFDICKYLLYLYKTIVEFENFVYKKDYESEYYDKVTDTINGFIDLKNNDIQEYLLKLYGIEVEDK